MRHRKKIVKLGRMSSHRKAMFSNMATSVILHKKIHTTLPKAKAVDPLVDHLVTLAKDGSLHSRRLAIRILKDHLIVRKLFSEIPAYVGTRQGGYTRIIKTGNRPGDGAPMALLELIGQVVVEEKPEKIKKEKAKGKEKEKGKEK